MSRWVAVGETGTAVGGDFDAPDLTTAQSIALARFGKGLEVMSLAAYQDYCRGASTIARERTVTNRARPCDR